MHSLNCWTDQAKIERTYSYEDLISGKERISENLTPKRDPLVK